MKVHHIGYAVKSINKSEKVFLDLGYEREGDVVEDNTRKLKILFMKCINGRVELLEAVEGETAITSILKKNRCCPYHICYECRDIRSMVEFYEKRDWRVIEQVSYAIALNGLVCFLYHMDYGLMELVEFKANEKLAE